MRVLLDTFEILIHVLLSGPGLAMLGLIALGVYLASRFAWGKHLGIPGLCAIGYLIILVVLFCFAATPDTGSMGFQVIPLFGATLPWSALFSLLHVPCFESDGLRGGFFCFVAMVVICGGLNCAIFLLLVRSIRGRAFGSTTTR